MHGNAWFTSKGVVSPGLMVMFGEIWEKMGQVKPTTKKFAKNPTYSKNDKRENTEVVVVGTVAPPPSIFKTDTVA